MSLEILYDNIKNAEKIVAFTGAGVSTQSGIPDYRTPGKGLWTEYSSSEIISIDGFTQKPDKFYKLFESMYDIFFKAEPNITHKFLAELEMRGKLKALVTQNIDGLHSRAGSINVLELHGTLAEYNCTSCGMEFGYRKVFNWVRKGINPPKCTFCGKTIRPKVVFFGEELPSDAMENAVAESRACDLFLVIGTSLQVMPAALLPGYAKSAGAKVCIINMMPTPYDSMADIVINDDLSSVFEYLKEKF